jgi:hypothetical protein
VFILARKFGLAEGPVPNTEYSLSDAPVLTGIGTQAKRSRRLTQ